MYVERNRFQTCFGNDLKIFSSHWSVTSSLYQTQLTLCVFRTESIKGCIGQDKNIGSLLAFSNMDIKLMFISKLS
jgi:hypothetical protein